MITKIQTQEQEKMNMKNQTQEQVVMIIKNQILVTENKDSQTNVDNKKNESVEGVSNTNKETTKNAQTTTQKSTKTGDQAPVEIFIGCCLVSFIAIIALKKKKALK